MYFFFDRFKKHVYLPSQNTVGALAQLVEQWTENPCVPGSIPGGTTKNKLQNAVNIYSVFLLLLHIKINAIIMLK